MIPSSNHIHCHRQIVLAAVTQNGDALRFAGGSMRSDREIIVAAMANKPLAFQVKTHRCCSLEGSIVQQNSHGCGVTFP
jgi:hypothetical protein